MKRLLLALLLLAPNAYAQTIGPPSFAAISGDCSFSGTAITCTKTNSTALTTLATSGFANIATPFETAAGFQALNATTGVNDTAFGYKAGRGITSGTDGTFVGFQAGLVDTGSFNSVFGSQTAQNMSSGGQNTIIGASSYGLETGASFNSVLGVTALNTENGSVGANTAIGWSALRGVTTGAQNTALGYGAGHFSGVTIAGQSNTNTVTTGLYGTYLGFQAAPSSTTARNYQTVLGAGAVGFDAANTVTLGLAGTDTPYMGAAVIGMKTITTYYIVSQLPSCTAALTAARAFVTDSAAAPVFSATATGGGALGIPVYCDGTAWRNG